MLPGRWHPSKTGAAVWPETWRSATRICGGCPMASFAGTSHTNNAEEHRTIIARPTSVLTILHIKKRASHQWTVARL